MKQILTISFIAIIVSVSLRLGNDIFISLENQHPSSIAGTYDDGELINGKRLPTKGANFQTYSYVFSSIGRTTVHSDLKKTILDAYEILYQAWPKKKFIYAETGWPSGGWFWPHEGHQIGLEADFIVPVVNWKKDSVPLPTHILNLWGYGYSFNTLGVGEDYTVDFTTISEHLYYLAVEGQKYNLTLDTVYISPDYHSHIITTPYGRKLENHVEFASSKSIYDYDSYYKVKFKVNN